MLDALHGKKLLHKTPTSLIKMTPAQGMVIQLDKLNEEVGAIDWGTLEQPDTGQVVDTNAIQPGDKAPASATAAGETALSDADLAASNLQQATSTRIIMRQQVLIGNSIPHKRQGLWKIWQQPTSRETLK